MASDDEIDIIVRGRDEASAAFRSAKGGLDDLERAAGKPGGGGGGVAAALGGIGTAATAAAGVAVVAIGTIAAGLFDVSERAAIAENALQGLENVNLDGVLRDASLLSTRYGVDTQEAVSATRTLMDEFGLTSEEAMDMLIAGFEGGLDTSGDFLDSVGEYSNLFAAGGADAAQFFSTLQTGMAGGVLGTDKAADAFKEFSIRIADGSSTTNQALQQLNLTSITDGLRNGSLTAVEAMAQVQTALGGIEDPIMRNQLGVALFGTQFEDLGASAILGINTAATSMDQLGASADAGRERFASLGEIGPRIWGEFTTALLPASEALLSVANEAAPALIGAMQGLGGLVSSASQGFAALVAGLFGTGEQSGVLSGIVAAAQPILDRLMTWVGAIADWFQAKMLPALTEAGQGFLTMLQPHIQWLADFATTTLMPALESVGQFIGDNLPGLISVLMPILTSLVDLGLSYVELALKAIATTWTTYLQPALAAMMEWIGKVTGGWENLKRGAEAVKNGINEIATSIRNLANVKLPEFKMPQFQMPSLPKFAGGVRNFGGGLAIVGEEGPELVGLPRGSNVTPAAQTARMLQAPPRAGGSSGASVTVAPSVSISGITVDSAQRVREVADAIVDRARELAAGDFARAIDTLILSGGTT